MRLHTLDQKHPRPKAKRVGRGIAAGQGKTAGRGTKGQKARTGANSNIPRTFEGAATSMIQRLPKLKGFKGRAVKPVVVNSAYLQKYFAEGDTISLAALVEKGLIKASEVAQGVKIVASSTGKTPKYTYAEEDNLRVSRTLAA